MFGHGTLALIGLFIIPVLSSGNAILSRAAFLFVDPVHEEAIHPLTLTLLRQLTAFIVFALIKFFSTPPAAAAAAAAAETEDSSADKKPHRELLRASIAQYFWTWILGASTGMNILFFLFGLRMASGLAAAAALSSIPPLVYVFGLYFKLERHTTKRALSALLVAVGNLLLVQIWHLLAGSGSNSSTTLNTTQQQHVPSSHPQHDLYFYCGFLLMLFAASCAALYLLYQKKVLDESNFSLSEFLFHMYAAALTTVLFFCMIPRDNIVMNQLLGGRLSRMSWIAALYGGLVQSAGNFYLFSYVTQHLTSIGSSGVAIVRATSPVLVVAESVVFLGEDINVWQVAGTVIIVIAIVLIAIPEKKSDEAPSAPVSVEMKTQQQQKEEPSATPSEGTARIEVPSDKSDIQN